MGISILEKVLRRLREKEFNATVAFPGQKYPQITETVAAVHIEKVDRAGKTVTLEINIICPASFGGTACELEALRATEVLQWDGAVCIQNGCTYDGASQVYMVAILATYTGVTEADSYEQGPGFRVYIDEVLQRYVVRFAEEESRGHKAEYAMGEGSPVGISLGSSMLEITMEEQIQLGVPENWEPMGAFDLRIERDDKTEVYYSCRWVSIRREFTKDGLNQIFRGIAMRKEVS